MGTPRGAEGADDAQAVDVRADDDRAGNRCPRRRQTEFELIEPGGGRVVAGEERALASLRIARLHVAQHEDALAGDAGLALDHDLALVRRHARAANRPREPGDVSVRGCERLRRLRERDREELVRPGLARDEHVVRECIRAAPAPSTFGPRSPGASLTPRTIGDCVRISAPAERTRAMASCAIVVSSSRGWLKCAITARCLPLSAMRSNRCRSSSASPSVDEAVRPVGKRFGRDANCLDVLEGRGAARRTSRARTRS